MLNRWLYASVVRLMRSTPVHHSRKAKAPIAMKRYFARVKATFNEVTAPDAPFPLIPVQTNYPFTSSRLITLSEPLNKTSIVNKYVVFRKFFFSYTINPKPYLFRS